uniref:Phage terminase, large subunit n=1 Tax=uncultured marine virus TaxID=186617 RepID=A0A0F7L2F4_9VIRU|nr:phage terminase, large subunit [uncultured marine virus]
MLVQYPRGARRRFLPPIRGRPFQLRPFQYLELAAMGARYVVVPLVRAFIETFRDDAVPRRRRGDDDQLLSASERLQSTPGERER